MKKINFKNNILSLLVLAIFLIPNYLFAMTIEIEKPVENISKGDVVVLDVYLNSGDQEINAIEGIITIDGDYEIKTISTAGSIFSLWPNKPSFSEGKISFTGGSTSGVFGSKLKIFSIALKINLPKNIVFSSNQIDVFLNNGIGTKVSVEKMDTNINIEDSIGDSKNELEQIILKDKISPQNFEIVIGKDQSLFDGKYFASFNALDNESGLNRYEIVENNNPSIRSGNTYLLQDQSLKGKLTVKAIDNAGNVRVVEIKVKDAISENNSINWFLIIIFVLLMIGIKFVAKYLKRKNGKK